jgi:hypothetical protein
MLGPPPQVSLDLQKIHTDILAAHESGGRGLRRFNASEVQELLAALQTPATRSTAIMVVAHSSHSERDLEAILQSLMGADLSTEDLVWLLNAARRHIIQGRFKEGERLTHEFLEALKALLHHRDGQVVEWTLRTVEECGAQGIVFRGELAKIRPRPWSLWRAQSRTILELVTYLERRWSAREKPV